MTQHLNRELEKLNRQVLSLSGMVEENLRKAVNSVTEKNSDLAREVIQADVAIDNMEIEVEEECLKSLALHQPVAVDLRYIISILKINNDLERIGDYAVNIAKRRLLLEKYNNYQIPDEIEDMAERVRNMLRMALDSLVQHDADKAREVMQADDSVDELNKAVYDNVKEKLKAGGELVSPQLQIMVLGRSLERTADHTTNIAEDIIYMIEGDIQHHQHKVV